jgi:hypothetical protein
MSADLRHLAIILDAGRQKAEEYRDASLSAALAATAEVAVALHDDPDAPGAAWDIESAFDGVAERYR